ncbi:MAG: PLP-dependent aminotransferase family protein, partial [Planctomycetota bacterium]|nr:PLP-dependent aminotransferase family protein [Planctomycetota bacterium]
YLSARVLINAGDLVAVEEHGYQPAWRAFRQAGAHLLPIPVDKDGLQVDALEQALKRESIRALYVTPHHQYPSQAILSASRRLRLLDLAKQHQFAIIEDDYDHEFHYDGPPVLPLASMDSAGSVIYIGTLSKVFAPGLRLGYAIAPNSIVKSMTRLRLCIDRQGSPIEEAALTELFEDALMERHIRRMTRLYKKRRDVLCDALNAQFPETLSFSIPKGGMAIWAKIIDRTNPESWAEEALEAGVHFTTGSEYAFDHQSKPYLRLGYALQNAEDILSAVQRMKVAHGQLEH